VENTIELQCDNVKSADVIDIEDVQLDLYYKMHKKVNEKNEEISKSYKNNILINFQDVLELHHKIIQSIQSIKCRADSLNVRIVVAHNEGEAEKFNSFEDFQNHNITSPNPTSEIALLYTFSCSDHETKTIESYKVVANLKSRIGELSQLEKEAPPFISSAILSSLVTVTARIKVEYTDYVKARHFIAMFDEWIKGCNESKETRYINTLKKVSHLITHFGKLLIIGLLGWFVSTSIGYNLINESDLLKFIIMYASVFYVVLKISELCLRKLELSIDSYLTISYLNINKGDGKLIAEFQKRNSRSILMSVIGVFGAVLVGIFTSASYEVIKYFLN